MEAAKLGLRIKIRRSDSNSNLKVAFTTIICETSGHRKKLIYMKFDDTETRKYGCPFKLREY